jgi:putative phosphoesterase
MLVGIISDTHGRFPEWVMAAFQGVDLIMHAGDVGSVAVLDELETIAPVRAVRGNMDQAPELSALPSHIWQHVDGLDALMVHEPEHAHALLASAHADVLVVGHTHRPRIALSGTTLVVNPGSASRSVGEGCSVALLRVAEGRASAEIVRE